MVTLYFGLSSGPFLHKWQIFTHHFEFRNFYFIFFLQLNWRKEAKCSLRFFRRLRVFVHGHFDWFTHFQIVRSFELNNFRLSRNFSILFSSSFSPSLSPFLLLFYLHFFGFIISQFCSDINRYADHEYHEITPQISHAVQEIHPIDTNNYGGETAAGVSGVGSSSSNNSNQQQQPPPFSGNHSYDILPPGVDREPPPPGFENEVIWWIHSWI